MAREYHVNLEIRLESGRADQQLAQLELALSPAGLGAFAGVAYPEWIRQRIAARFAMEGDDMSGPWQQLAPLTQETRAAQGFGAAHPINVRTGEMENYLTNNVAGVIPDTNGVTVVYPAREPSDPMLRDKLLVAQMGGLAGTDPTYAQAPPRPVLGFNERDLLYFLEITTVYVQEAATRV